MKHTLALLSAAALLILSSSCSAQDYSSLVNPLLGTSTLWKAEDLGFEPDFGPNDPYGEGKRIWGGETFPGPALPNALVQMVPITSFGSGSGYQYEDDHIYGFAHTNKGHWNLGNIPVMPIAGKVDIRDYSSPFSHERETAQAGYYKVSLDRYGIEAELTSTLRCGIHRYTFPKGAEKSVLFNLARANERVYGWDFAQVSPRVLTGVQKSKSGDLWFYAECSEDIVSVDSLRFPMRPPKDMKGGRPHGPRPENLISPAIPVLHFSETSGRTLVLSIGFSYVSAEGAEKNLRAEVGSRDFEEVRRDAVNVWNAKLGQIAVEGGTADQQKMFYSCLYRAFMWPALRSDVDGQFPSPTDGSATTFDNKDRIHHFYTTPSYWDDYRNKLILLGMLSPEVASDVISSDILRGERTGHMPTFFHGDHASSFVTGSYLRGIRDFDIRKAYDLMLANATVPAEWGGRPFIADYIRLGYVPELDLHGVEVDTRANTGVTKTLEYAYDDYSVALLARELGDSTTYKNMMERSGNYRNVFDASTGFMRGRTEKGKFISEFDPYRPYFYFQYREANCWQSSFFAPQDPAGLIGLYPSPEAFEAKLDSLFSEPWQGYNHHNMTAFIGNYCHGNQPDHGFPYMYYYVGKQEKCQKILNLLMSDYYGMGEEGLALAGMDDAGEMTSWYVMNAIGLYPFSPSDPLYIVTVPLFDRVRFTFGDGSAFSVSRQGSGEKISDISLDGRSLNGWMVDHSALTDGAEITITTE